MKKTVSNKGLVAVLAMSVMLGMMATPLKAQETEVVEIEVSEAVEVAEVIGIEDITDEEIAVEEVILENVAVTEEVEAEVVTTFAITLERDEDDELHKQAESLRGWIGGAEQNLQRLENQEGTYRHLGAHYAAAYHQALPIAYRVYNNPEATSGDMLASVMRLGDIGTAVTHAADLANVLDRDEANMSANDLAQLYTVESIGAWNVALADLRAALQDPAFMGMRAMEPIMLAVHASSLVPLTAVASESTLEELAQYVAGVSAEGLQETNYTVASWTALQKAIASATEVAANTAATEGEVQIARDAVLAARNGLVNAGEVTTQAEVVANANANTNANTNANGIAGKAIAAKTGDIANAAAYTVSLLLASAVIAVLAVRKKKMI